MILADIYYSEEEEKFILKKAINITETSVFICKENQVNKQFKLSIPCINWNSNLMDFTFDVLKFSTLQESDAKVFNRLIILLHNLSVIIHSMIS